MSNQESIMKAQRIFTLVAVALAATGALAEQAVPLTRPEVRQQVLAARASGTLAHAGDAAPEERTAYKAQVEAPSTLTRAEAQKVVLEARASHQLAHAGATAPEEEMAHARAHPSTSTVVRADVGRQVREARASGTLVPAGEGSLGDASRSR
jgi:hypothetical protein